MPDQNPQPDNMPEQTPENVKDNKGGEETSIQSEFENVPVPEKPIGAPETPSQVQSPVSQQPIQPAVPVSDDNAKSPLPPDEIVPDETDANEVDIIEKPWVKKAEDIIKKDKGKPYFEEEDHEDLQIDYLKKRFGKDIKKSD